MSFKANCKQVEVSWTDQIPKPGKAAHRVDAAFPDSIPKKCIAQGQLNIPEEQDTDHKKRCEADQGH